MLATHTIADAHCHFFSSGFLEILTRDRQDFPATGRAAAAARFLGWDDPGPAPDLARRWVAELDEQGVDRAMLIASIPGDEESVAAAVGAHPARFVGAFMFNPAAPDAAGRLERALSELRLRTVALFPAMHHYSLADPCVTPVFDAAQRHGAAVFVHCGALTVGVRKRLGLASPFDWRLGDPLAVAAVAVRYPTVPVIVPHFGAGFFRDALMAADQCPNLLLDTSSSNRWMTYHPGLTLEAVFRQAVAVAGADRLLFGTDSSFYPRGWQRAIYESQRTAMTAAGLGEADIAKILGGNFARVFGPDGARLE
ncbi:MAG TPA: amidohydrolase family protein [Vicinamibacterales bacterium]|nr:amidohydrolase family protein [Vicinamibacterales bacterium]